VLIVPGERPPLTGGSRRVGRGIALSVPKTRASGPRESAASWRRQRMTSWRTTRALPRAHGEGGPPIAWSVRQARTVFPRNTLNVKYTNLQNRIKVQPFVPDRAVLMTELHSGSAERHRLPHAEVRDTRWRSSRRSHSRDRTRGRRRMVRTTRPCADTRSSLSTGRPISCSSHAVRRSRPRARRPATTSGAMFPSVSGGKSSGVTPRFSAPRCALPSARSSRNATLRGSGGHVARGSSRAVER